MSLRPDIFSALGLVMIGSIWLAGCSHPIPSGSLVMTERPASSRVSAPGATILDERYPLGSRVVLLSPPYRAQDVKVLSVGLIAAGDIVVNTDGRCVIFAGKAQASSAWQIYQTRIEGGPLQRLTALEGGAMNPAVLANGDLVFSSPVPKTGDLCNPERLPALFALSPGSAPRRLTFGTSPAVEPTLLQDGRILFVSAQPARMECPSTPTFALFTVNNDGTELTPFALDQDGAPIVRRPRELPDGRIAYLAAGREAPEVFRAEMVRRARPFTSRTPLLKTGPRRCTSLAADGNGALLLCADTRGVVGRSMGESTALFRIPADAGSVNPPLFFDPAWDVIEAAAVSSSIAPMGHISAMMPGKKTGTILCLNANFTRPDATNGVTGPAKRVRVLAAEGPGQSRVLGEVALQADGSFMAEVPADVPFGLETLDEKGRVLQRLPPAVWVRPGENRSCLGCHEPYNRSPRNIRPLAAAAPAARLTGPDQRLAPGKP